MSIASEIARLQTAKADLKTAIEAKGVTVSASDTLDDYPALVAAIPTGSGFDENADVCFWDYDGTPLYSFSFDEIDQMITLPVPPDHSQDEVPLTFLRWNWTLADLQDAHIPADVGAIYHPTDGKMHFFYRLTPTTGLTTTFKSTQSQSYYVDWGDGTPIENWGSSTTNGANPTHTYANYGTYHVSVEGRFIPTESLCVEAPNALVKGLYISANNNDFWLGSYWKGVATGASVETITGYIRTSANPQPFAGCPYLKFFVFADGGSALCMNNSSSLQGVSMPRNANLGAQDYFLSGCTSLRRIRFGDALTRNRFMLQAAPVAFMNPPGGFRYSDAANCYSLRRIVVNDNIAQGALAACPIEELWCGMDTVPTLYSSTQFTGLRKNAVFHVKASMLESFKTATNWSAYADYFVGDWAENPDR